MKVLNVIQEPGKVTVEALNYNKVTKFVSPSIEQAAKVMRKQDEYLLAIEHYIADINQCVQENAEQLKPINEPESSSILEQLQELY